VTLRRHGRTNGHGAYRKLHSGLIDADKNICDSLLLIFMVQEFPEVVDMHDVEIKRVRGKVYMSCHCTMSDDLPLSRVHDISTELEIRFKQAAPELFKVLIHPEPQTDNRR